MKDNYSWAKKKSAPRFFPQNCLFYIQHTRFNIQCLLLVAVVLKSMASALKAHIWIFPGSCIIYSTVLVRRPGCMYPFTIFFLVKSSAKLKSWGILVLFCFMPCILRVLHELFINTPLGEEKEEREKV